MKRGMARRLRGCFCLIAGLLLSISAPSVQASQAKRVLTVMNWRVNETEATKKWFAFAKETFEARHPGVEVRYQTAPWGDEYKQKVILTSTSGVGPDAVFLSIIWARDLFEQGALIPLNEFVARNPDIAPDKMYPICSTYNQKDGYIFGITGALDFGCILYDLDAFEETGLDTDPYALRNWNDFITAARKLMRVQPNNTITRWGFCQGLYPETFAAWLAANGGSFYNSDLTKAGFNNTKGIQTAEFLYKLYQQYKVVGGDVIKGTAGMGYAINATPYFIADTNPKLRFNMTSFPAGPSSNRRGTVAWANMWSIPKGSKNPDLAWEFIHYMTSLEGNLGEFKHIAYVGSPRPDFYLTPEWKQVESKFRWARMHPEIAAVGGIYPFRRYTEMVTQIWDPLLGPALTGSKAIESAFREAERIYNMILSK